MESKQIQATASRYKQISLWLTAGLVIAILIVCRVSKACDEILPGVVTPLVVSALFSLIASTAYGEAWKAIAMKSPANLAKFYLAASALKMMLGAVTFLVSVVLIPKASIIGFTAVFMLFYIILLVFDCIYFARIERGK